MNQPIHFSQWMEQALYNRRSGYYSRRIEAVGDRGDFTTAPMISGHLSHAIGKWVDQAMQETGARDLIEIGPGNGILAKNIWKSLSWIRRRTCKLHLVETSEPLKQQQRKLMNNKVLWHRTPEEAMEASGGRAIIYSNELVDAFPCMRYELTPVGWQEIAVQYDECQQAHEVLLPVESRPCSSIFASRNRERFTIGQRVEVHLPYKQWLQRWLPLWKAGRMLTIDYGAKAEHLYQRQPQGSIRAYFLHQRLTGMEIYQNMGRQDLTADVNFTDLIEWSETWTSHSALQTLADFIADRSAQKRLLDPQGAGGAFKVLEQRPL